MKENVSDNKRNQKDTTLDTNEQLIKTDKNSDDNKTEELDIATITATTTFML